MNQNLSLHCAWYLVTIDDYPRMLTGKTFYEIIKLIQDTEKTKFVIFDAVDAIGKKFIFKFMHDNVDEIFTIESILGITNDIDHVEWGDFFMFKDYPKNWKNPKGELYPYVIAQADTTLRAVDDQYMYIYTQSKCLVDKLKSHYAIESLKLDLLDNLDFPE